MRLPWRRDRAYPEDALGQLVKPAVDRAADAAGIKPGGFPDEPRDGGETENEDDEE